MTDPQQIRDFFSRYSIRREATLFYTTGNPIKLSSNVVDGGASGSVLDLLFTVDEADAADDVAEAGRAVQPAPAPLGALAQTEDHGQRRAP